ncbi:MAG: SHOCT domain-containing protein, partial [Clostridia bacterium]
AIFGVSLIIGGVKFMELSNVNDKQLLDEKGKILGWTIFFSIALFPIGLFSVFIYSNLEDVEKDNTKTQASVKKDSFEDKVEKIKVLSELKQNGLIDEEEFKTAKGKILE